MIQTPQELTADETFALCAIPEEVYQALAWAVCQEYQPLTCAAMDREVLKRWREQEGTPNGHA